MDEKVITKIHQLIRKGYVVKAKLYQMPNGCVINKDHIKYVTFTEQREQTYRIIKKIVSEPLKHTIIDLTANAGGDVIALCQVFKQVIAVELDPISYLCLAYNLGQVLCFKNTIIYNKNSSKIYNKLIKMYKPKYAFLDPVWGLDYKQKQSVTLQLNDSKLSLTKFISNLIAKHIQVFVKVPLNYNRIQFQDFQVNEYPIYRLNSQLYYLLHVL